MNVIEKFLPFVGVHPSKLNRHVEHHACLTIAKKYSALTYELQKARLAALGAVSVGADGGVSVANQPGMATIQNSIAELEGRIARLVKIAGEYGSLLDEAGVTNPTIYDLDIHHKLSRLVQKTEIEPAVWQRFTLLHDTDKRRFPDEILADPEFAEYEKELLAQRSKAAQQIPRLREIEARLYALGDEAWAL